MFSLWTAIGGALDQESAKAKGIRKEKEKEKKDNDRAKKRAKLASGQIHHDSETEISTVPSTPSTWQSSSSVSTRHHQKTPSNNTEHSLASQSTDTPPRVFEQPEACVQEIQNTFVRQVFLELGWVGGVPIPWVQG